MINPNIHKRVRVIVAEDRKTATYNGHVLEINDYRYEVPMPGSRYLYLKFSMFNDRYYLTSNKRK